MIEGRGLPGARGVTGLASLRESPRHVAGIGCVLEVFQVARNTGRSRQIVIPVDVAVRTLARRDRVHAGQREVHHAVIEARWGPPARGMTLRTICGKAGRHVIGILRALEIRHVTADAGRAG